MHEMIATKNDTLTSGFFRETPDATWEVIAEFFTARIRNSHTRKAYMHGVRGFVMWCDSQSLTLKDVKARHVATWVELHTGAPASVRLHLSALRQLFDYMTIQGIIPVNPATPVKNPRLSRTTGKTPVMEKEDARILLDSLPDTPAGKRDRALIAAMIFSFARISALLKMNVEDYYSNGRRAYLRLREKGGKEKDLPVHVTLAEYLDDYIRVAGIADEKKGPLFRSANSKRDGFEKVRYDRSTANRMIKRRTRNAGIGEVFSCHTFRATGITEYLKAGGTLEKAQQLAGHSSSATTKLYDRRNDEVGLDELQRIVI